MTIRGFLTLLLVLGALRNTQSQQLYSDYNASDKLDAYFDDFSSNEKKNYVGETDNGKYTLINGVYRLENKTDEMWVKFLTSDPTCSSPSLLIDQTRDFELELSVRFVRGTDNQDISLTWGADRKDCSDIVGDRNLGVSGNGYYRYYEYDLEGNFMDIVPWVESPLVRKGEYNKLTVRKVMSHIYLFVNEQLVHVMNAVAFNGQFNGVSFPKKTVVEVDYFRASYLQTQNSMLGRPAAVYFDDFLDNKKGNYESETDNGSYKVINGAYRFENKTDGFWTKYMLMGSDCGSAPYVYIDEQRDYEIEFAIRTVVTSSPDNDISLRWGANYIDCKSITSHYNLGYATSGSYLIYEYNASQQYVEHKPWEESSLISKSGYNKLTVRKKGTTDELLINGQVVHTMPHKPFHGKYFGVSLPAKTTVDIDYIKVSYTGSIPATGLPATANDTPPEIILVSPVAAKNEKITVFQGQLMVSGYAKDDSGIKAIAVNAKPVAFNKQGYFETILDLAPGSNFVTLKAEDADGNVTAMAFNCERQEGRSLGTGEEEQVRTNPARRALSSNYLKGKRVALVIGNKNYKVKPLTNSVNDAMDMATTLTNRGFEVISLYDAKTKADIRNAIVKFTQAVRGDPEAISLFYYSGHGMQIDGVNYLVPTEANLEIRADVDDQCMNMDFVMRAMDETNNPLKIVIMDACRDNPFRSFSRSGEQGLNMVDAPKGTYIVFATKPGSVASDGTGRNGLFTSKLLQFINEENLTLEEVFKKVAAEVSKDSQDRQRPWISSDFTGEFYFNLKN